MSPTSVGTPSALEALRATTASAHRDLEERVRIADPAVTASDYAAYIAAFYGWLAPLEGPLWSAPWPPEMQPAARAVKTTWLEHDLEVAGWDMASLPLLARCSQLPQVESEAQRYGIAYVLEGSTLGGRVLERRLRRGEMANSPLRFLQGYGDRTAPLWKSFLESLERRGSSQEFRRTASESAAETFTSLTRWFVAQGVARD